LGDANETHLLRNMQPSAGVVFRDNLNFRWAMKTDLLWGQVSGDTQNETNVFPNGAQATFKRSFVELGAQMEFNFLPYSDKYSYLNTSKISPYMLAGLGVTLGTGEKTAFGLNIPLGIGVKYKLKNRVNLGAEYTVHRLLNDNFDAPKEQSAWLDNPYRVEQGLFKNKDWYNTLLFSLTWEFGLRDERCTTD
jgi:opacity protein-like surface antigen